MNKRFIIMLGTGLLVGAVLVFYAAAGRTSHTPRPQPPQGATNVFFQEHRAWQTWDYFYRFDASPAVCRQFAIELMKQQSHRQGACVITTTNFTRFPVDLSHPPAWFDVSTVTNGLLLTADEWFYAVIDHGRGRLYYYNGD